MRSLIRASRNSLISFLSSKVLSHKIYHSMFFFIGISELLASMVELKSYPSRQYLTLFLFPFSFVAASWLSPRSFSFWPRSNLSSFLSQVTLMSLRCSYLFSFSSLEMVALSYFAYWIGTCVGSGTWGGIRTSQLNGSLICYALSFAHLW